MNLNRLKPGRILVLGLLGGNFLLYGSIFWPSDPLKITFLDVGQGDAILIQFPEKKTMLIDAGPRGFHSDAGARHVVPFLKANGIGSLDAVIVSHPHSDHLGGVPAVLRSCKVGKFMNAGSDTETAVNDEVTRLLDSLDVPRIRLRTGDRIDDFPDVRLYVVHPSGSFVADGSRRRTDMNNQSIVILLVYGSTRALFVGDAEEEAEVEMVRVYGGFLRSQLLKVGHHGSKTSSTDEFIRNVDPRLAVISVGMKNKFDHPSPSVLNRLAGHNTAAYRTDVENAVVFSSDGREWKRDAWR